MKNDEPTGRFVRTKFGQEGWTEAATCYLKLVDGTATQLDADRLWEVLKVVFGKTGSLPPGQWGGGTNT